MVNETGASSAKFLREAASRQGPDEEARARAERGRAKNAALAASNDVQQLSSELVSAQLRRRQGFWVTFLSSTNQNGERESAARPLNSFGWPGP